LLTMRASDSWRACLLEYEIFFKFLVFQTLLLDYLVNFRYLLKILFLLLFVLSGLRVPGIIVVWDWGGHRGG
jgi:hypothetical protein